MTTDDRPEPPYLGDETGTLTGFLDFHRATLLWKIEDPDADWRVEPSAASSLDEVAHHPRRKLSRRWILVHLIEETARHNGQADILREQLAGVTGE